MNVHVLLRQHKDYPYHEVTDGIRCSGDSVVQSGEISGEHSVVTWNNYGYKGRFATQIKEAGGLHIVMENGYMRRDKGFYLMNRDGFNGLEPSAVMNHDPVRFENLDLNIQPWKKDGKHILVCGQRGGNYSPLSMPNNWPTDVLRTLRTLTDRPILYRAHPARERAPTKSPESCFRVSSEEPLKAHLKNAFAVVVWTSNAATEALLYGIPVFYCGPTLATKKLALAGLKYINAPFYTNREQVFWDLAWHQWDIEEIRSGKAWRHVSR